jgi:hypothetical protein
MEKIWNCFVEGLPISLFAVIMVLVGGAALFVNSGTEIKQKINTNHAAEITRFVNMRDAFIGGNIVHATSEAEANAHFSGLYCAWYPNGCRLLPKEYRGN